MSRAIPFCCLLVTLLVGCSRPEPEQTGETWLAGDHHVHSQYSIVPDRSVDPPIFRPGSHGVHPIPKNARMASEHGLSWMVSTDHGGRDHAKINLEQAYPELLEAREAVPGLVQFFGFELNSPGADHSSIIVPHTHDEADRVYQIESQFDSVGAAIDDGDANTTKRMLDALTQMQAFSELPVVIANHPSRRAEGGEKFGLTSPSELRAWNDAAPEIVVGMAGAPGHQAAALNADGTANVQGNRGNYNGQPTFGGFDVMTAELGGFWDSMLGEGRHWWITANSDSHDNWRAGGVDFWPGEFSKTYVYARKHHDDILSSLRAGHVFVTTGDLISEVYVTVTNKAGKSAEIGGSLTVRAGDEATVTIRLKDPDGENHHGDAPAVSRVDVIVGEVYGAQDDPDRHMNPSTRVLRRFGEADWSRNGEYLTMTEQFPADKDLYVRVRGTNTNEAEPMPDTAGENPWNDLWFYSNPIFVIVE